MRFIICILFSVSILIIAMCFENFAWRISMLAVSYLFSFLCLENTKTGRHQTSPPSLQDKCGGALSCCVVYFSFFKLFKIILMLWTYKGIYMGDNAIHSMTNFTSIFQCSGIMLFTISPHIERAIIPTTKIAASFFDGTTLTAIITAKSITKLQKKVLGYLAPRKINEIIQPQKASIETIKTIGLFFKFLNNSICHLSELCTSTCNSISLQHILENFSNCFVMLTTKNINI